MARKVTGLSGVPIGNPAGGSTREICTRPIDNGFIIRESNYGDGEYETRERFSKTAPGLPSLKDDRAGAVGDERLSGAIKECKS
jgi:hypothetical protein